MKKNTISRRDFMKGVTTGAITFTILPSLSCGRSPAEKKADVIVPALFDCNKYFGPGFPKSADFPDAGHLVRHLDRLGIDRAVTWHTSARNQHPMNGNELLINEIKSAGQKDRLIPSFVISPSIINDPGETDHFLRLVSAEQVRAFHFFPKEINAKIRDISPLIRKIISFNPVLFLDSFENLGDDLSEILDFSREFPQLNIIFTNAMWVHCEKLFKLMEARPNIMVDTSWLHIYRINEYIISKFGSNRLIFGTGYKSNNGAAIAALAHADVTLENARMIAHGNLERLLGIKSPLTNDKTIKGDRLWHRLLRKEPLGPDIIDSHTHMARTIVKWEDHDQEDIDTHAKLAIRSMDTIGVSSMIIAEYTLYDPDLEGNKTFLETNLEKYGDRFHSYFPGLAARSLTEDQLIRRLDNIFSRNFYVGFKMHNSHWNIPVTDDSFTPVWKYADKHRLPILLHTWNDNLDAPKMMKDIVSRYPNAIFILGHSGSDDRPDAESLAMENPNVYLEWCGSFLNTTDWRETFDRLGNNRILYGSDFISWETQWGHDPAWEIGRLLSMDVPDETFVPVLGENMRRILALRR